MNINFAEFGLDKRIVAPCIYGELPHRCTSTGVVLSKLITDELGRLVRAFNAFLKVTEAPYYRIDAYFDQDRLWILEINAAFVDGWGTALNLARASNIFVKPGGLNFPNRFATLEPEYLPELELFAFEVAQQVQFFPHARRIVPYQLGWSLTEPTYVYGRLSGVVDPNILPFDGTRLDNKLNLAAFSRVWQSQLVTIPRHYQRRFEAWEDIPDQSVFKFCDKDGPESLQARTSVIIGKPTGKAKFLKNCYEAETLIAQDLVQPASYEGNNCQAIIMVSGDRPVTGYVQFSPNLIINDNSVHGPLCLE